MLKQTALIKAAENGHEQVIALLLDGKANVAATDKHGKVQ
jgi:ankyrin repeat protein